MILVQNLIIGLTAVVVAKLRMYSKELKTSYIADDDNKSSISESNNNSGRCTVDFTESSTAFSLHYLMSRMSRSPG